jgi:hypothetical protein
VFQAQPFPNPCHGKRKNPNGTLRSSLTQNPDEPEASVSTPEAQPQASPSCNLKGLGTDQSNLLILQNNQLILECFLTPGEIRSARDSVNCTG